MSILVCYQTVRGIHKLHPAVSCNMRSCTVAISRCCTTAVSCNMRSCTVQVLYNSSQMQTKEMQAKLDSQKRKRQQLEVEVSASQAHIAELTAILKSAVRSNSASGPAGSQSPRAAALSPRSAALSREASGGEVGPRLRSKELQGEAHCIQLLDSVRMASVNIGVHCMWHICLLLAGV